MSGSQPLIEMFALQFDGMRAAPARIFPGL